MSFYHLPIVYWRRLKTILEEERDLQPEWASTIAALQDSPSKSERKDAELEAADCVIVNSQFVAESLAMVPKLEARVELIPYGAPHPSQSPLHRRGPSDPLRILYAGQLRQHKGISYLFEALGRLTIPYKLSLAGPLPTLPCTELERELAKPHHQWLGVLPHTELLEVMNHHHVLVFPSLAEGFGLVVTEALASGLPVIATSHTCAPEVINEGVEGFVISIRDSDAIRQNLTHLYENEDRRYTMAEAARRKATEASWTIFENRISQLVATLTA
jgi:glycosyltransferase involved in cell wall biosynthesis